MVRLLSSIHSATLSNGRQRFKRCVLGIPVSSGNTLANILSGEFPYRLKGGGSVYVGVGMSRHTPGPWEYMESSIVGPKLDDKETWLRPVVARFATGVSLANLNLMLAAPELLAVAEELVRKCERLGINDWQMKLLPVARAAIRKATGGPA